MLAQFIAIAIGALSLGFAIWQYRRTRIPRLRLSWRIGVLRANFEGGSRMEQPIVELKALNIGHVPVTLEQLTARTDGRDEPIGDCWLHVDETNEFPHRLDQGASWLGTFDYFGLEETIARLFGPLSTQHFTLRLCDATDRTYDAELELADHKIPPLTVFRSVDEARAVFAAMRRSKEEHRRPELARFVPLREPSRGRLRKKRKRK